MSSSQFEREHGFPRGEVRLGNWRQAPWNVWSFCNVSELMPTARIAATPGLTEEPGGAAEDFLRAEISVDREQVTVAEVLTRTSTDALVVLKSGRIAVDYHARSTHSHSRHILFSISKSVAAIVAGVLEEEGLLEPGKMVVDYVPELKSSAYGDARVRDVLDMRVSIDFDDAYQDVRGDFARYRRAGLVDPPKCGEAAETIIDFLASLKKAPRDHGGPFHYASPNSDVLGVIIERASGDRFADAAAARLWQPLGARQDGYVMVDGAGTSRTGGGICVTARDLARVGEMMRLGGITDGRRLVAEEWVRDTVTGGSTEAWSKGNFGDWLPSGRYRNQWYQTGAPSGAFFGIGIYGQWLYVDPTAEIVVAKLSSQPEPTSIKRDNFALFDALSGLL